jgi:hypothetical protein
MRLTRKTIVAAAAAIACVGAGAALAADKLLSPKQESDAIIQDAAKRLGVQPTALSDALKAAFKARIDAAVADGRITKERADELKARIDSGGVPLLPGGPGFRGGPGGHHGPMHHLTAAASYLDLTEPALADALRGGKTLAQVAKDKGKSVDGLVAALVADEKKELAAAVAAGRLTDAQRDRMEQNLEARTKAFVNGERILGFRHDRGGESFGFRFQRHESGAPVS